jgi:hypothetical protein
MPAKQSRGVASPHCCFDEPAPEPSACSPPGCGGLSKHVTGLGSADAPPCQAGVRSRPARVTTAPARGTHESPGRSSSQVAPHETSPARPLRASHRRRLLHPLMVQNPPVASAGVDVDSQTVIRTACGRFALNHCRFQTAPAPASRTAALPPGAAARSGHDSCSGPLASAGIAGRSLRRGYVGAARDVGGSPCLTLVVGAGDVRSRGRALDPAPRPPSPTPSASPTLTT